MNNDKKIKAYQKKRFAKWILIAIYIGVITLEILALCNVLSMWWGLILFVIVYIFEKIFLK